ncbi:uncharacterized protein LOC102716738 [Oryza brachyantha]|uniref:Uncharacterized protein n=1 Tax=Oryza brachyantha TaxID=4533 RepID=J3L6E0_ORYBR|nr:uncharacterized protein LOC102716738 [Oryza brachyantha]
MDGYCNLVSSPRVASGAVEESKWEGVAVGAAALVRNLSSASQRFRAVERSRSTSGGGGGLQAVVRRAFSMRRQPSSFTDGYWRIHDDMDGDAAGEHQEHAAYEEAEQKRVGEQNHATSKKDRTTKKKGRIFKACRKLLGF